jgi:hypothetical protein
MPSGSKMGEKSTAFIEPAMRVRANRMLAAVPRMAQIVPATKDMAERDGVLVFELRG